MCGTVLTGIREIDEASFGIFFGVIGRLSFYKLPSVVKSEQESIITRAELDCKLTLKDATKLDRRRLQNYIFAYPEDLGIENVFDALQFAFSGFDEFATCVGIVSGKGIVAFIRRR